MSIQNVLKKILPKGALNAARRLKRKIEIKRESGLKECEYAAYLEKWYTKHIGGGTYSI